LDRQGNILWQNTYNHHSISNYPYGSSIQSKAIVPTVDDNGFAVLNQLYYYDSTGRYGGFNTYLS